MFGNSSNPFSYLGRTCCRNILTTLRKKFVRNELEFLISFIKKYYFYNVINTLFYCSKKILKCFVKDEKNLLAP